MRFDLILLWERHSASISYLSYASPSISSTVHDSIFRSTVAWLCIWSSLAYTLAPIRGPLAWRRDSCHYPCLLSCPLCHCAFLWGTVEYPRLWLVATLPIFSCYSHSILNDRLAVFFLLHITMSEFPLCNFTAFYAWLVKVLLLLRADPSRLISEILVCWCLFNLTSVKRWRRWTLWLFCTILVSTKPCTV